MPFSRADSWKLRMGPPRGGAGRPSLHLTQIGVVYVCAATLIGVAAFHASVNLLFLVLGLAVGVLIVSNGAARGALRRVAVTRSAPDAVLAGRSFTIRYTVRNTRLFGEAHSIRISETARIGERVLQLEGYVEVVPAGQTVDLDLEVRSPARGVLRFAEIQVSTHFPFGLFARRLSIAAAHETTSFPALLGLRRRLDRAARSAAHAAAAERSGGDDEFYGLREYRQGDSPKRIAWRRSARTGQLVVREMSEVKPSTLIVVIDPHATAALADARESAISAAATLLCHGLELGYKVGLIAAAGTPIVIPPTTGRGLRAKLLSQLATLDASSAGDGIDAFLRTRRWPAHWRGRCLLVGAGGRPGFWRAANILKSRFGQVDAVAAGSPEFGAWFTTIGGDRSADGGAAA